MIYRPYHLHGLPEGVRPGEVLTFPPHGRVEGGAGGGLVPPSEIYSQPFTYIADARDLANAGGLGGTFGVPDFLWVAGDGNTPTIGAALSLTGAPTVGVSPHEESDGTDIATEVHTGTSNRRNVVANNPTLTQDIVIFMKVFIPRISSTGYVLGTHVAKGMKVFCLSANQSINFQIVANATVQVAGSANFTGKWEIVTIVIDRSGTMSLVIDGLLINSGLTPAGAITGGGVSIASTVGGASVLGAGSQIEFVGFIYGTNIAPDWVASSYALCKEFTNRFSGIYPELGTDGAFVRASAASWIDHNDKYALASSGLPRSGDSDGLRAATTRINEAYLNVNPQNVVALTWTGADAPTAVDDSAALAAEDAEAWGPNTYEYANTTGVTQYVRMSAQTGDTVARSLQCLARITAGAGTVKLGLYDESAGTFVGTAIINGYYARTRIHGQTPGDTDCTLCLEVETATTIRWVAHDMSKGARCETPTPNWATAAAATRNASVLTTGSTPSNTEGSVELTVEPMGWGGAEAGVVGVLIHATAGIYTLVVDGGTWQALIDGTTTLDSGVAPVNGVPATIRLRWGSLGKMSIDVDGTRVSAAYDGTLRAVSAWQISPSAEVAVTNFKAYDNGN